jgi:hypothetical protein
MLHTQQTHCHHDDGSATTRETDRCSVAHTHISSAEALSQTASPLRCTVRLAYLSGFRSRCSMPTPAAASSASTMHPL